MLALGKIHKPFANNTSGTNGSLWLGLMDPASAWLAKGTNKYKFVFVTLGVFQIGLFGLTSGARPKKRVVFASRSHGPALWILI